MVRVLVIDDDVRVRSLLRLMLEQGGFEVEEADDGLTGIQAFRYRRADLVFCDLIMPKKEGTATIRELCREFPGGKVVAMTGCGFRGQVDMLAVALRLGALGALYKPFTRAAVLRAAAEALQSPPEGNLVPPVG
jgi:DNA-binding NtrC family response regulator